MGGRKMQQVIETIEKNLKEQVRIELTEFKGYDLLAVRVYAKTDSGFIATKKGITVNVKLLPDLVNALQKAEAAAIQAGLIAKG
jgi:hypothetical protein